MGKISAEKLNNSAGAENYNHTKRMALLIAFVLLGAVHVHVLKNAPIAGGDTHHYVDAVNELMNDHSLTNRNQNYSGFILFLAFCKVITPRDLSFFVTAVAIQSFFSFIALYCVFIIGGAVFSRATAVLSALFFSLDNLCMYFNSISYIEIYLSI